MSERQPELTKTCPMCGEKILDVAIKCKHCGHSLDRDEQIQAVRRWLRPWKILVAAVLLSVVAAGLVVYKNRKQLITKVLVWEARKGIGEGEAICLGLAQDGSRKVCSVASANAREALEEAIKDPTWRSDRRPRVSDFTLALTEPYWDRRGFIRRIGRSSLWDGLGVGRDQLRDVSVPGIDATSVHNVREALGRAVTKLNNAERDAEEGK